MEKYYNIHDIVTFKIANRAGLLDWQFNNIHRQYQDFESGEIDGPDFTVYLGDFVPSNQDCYIVGDRYYIKEDYFYCEKDSHKLAKWRFEISGFESGETVAYIASNLWGYLYMCGFIIDFLIHFKLNEKGYPIVHGSAVSKNDHACLLAARSGGGKTIAALYLVEKGFDFLADNFTILHQGSALSFPSPLNIFTYNLTPMIRRNLGIKERIILELKSLLYKLTLGYVKIFTKIDTTKAFAKHSTKSKLDTVLLLIPEDEFRIESMDKEELVNHLTINQEVEALSFFGYMSEYAYMFPESSLSTHWDTYRQNLTEALNGSIRFYKVTVPAEYSPEVLERILRLIQDATNAEL